MDVRRRFGGTYVSSFRVKYMLNKKLRRSKQLFVFLALKGIVGGTGINLLLYVMFYCRGERAELLLNSHALSDCRAF
jgi:hypothetical protein